MGFRSMLMLEDCLIGGKPSSRFNTVCERKFYDKFEDDEFIQNIRNEMMDDESAVGILLHECGGITRLEISKDKVLANEPSGWDTVEHVTHSYCYGCSDIKEI